MSQLRCQTRHLFSASIGGVVAAIWFLQLADPEECCRPADPEAPAAESHDAYLSAGRENDADSTHRSDTIPRRHAVAGVAPSPQNDLEPGGGPSSAGHIHDDSAFPEFEATTGPGFSRTRIHTAWGPPLYRIAPSHSPPVARTTPRTPVERG